jgi:hypothetical protein
MSYIERSEEYIIASFFEGKKTMVLTQDVVRGVNNLSAHKPFSISLASALSYYNHRAVTCMISPHG